MSTRSAVKLNIPRVIQIDGCSCGAHCAYAIARYYGVESVRDFDELYDPEGTTEDDLREFFEAKGLKPRRIYRPTVEKLRKEIRNGFPVLISTDEDHWAVVRGFSKGRIDVMDPSLVRSLFPSHSIKYFLDRWDRWAMAIRD